MRTPDDVRVLHTADIYFQKAWVPVNAWTISGGDGLLLVDTGVVETTPELEAEWPLRLQPWPELGDVVAIVNTHLHFDHCGANRSFPGTPIYVQRAEYEAVAEPAYLVDWVRFPGARYELVEGDQVLLPGISVLFTPGHSPGHQAVVVETTEGPVVLAGDVTYDLRELETGDSPAIERIRRLEPCRVHVSHAAEPWAPA
ncbi:MAG: MBL fold metallo-hydrolase [Candidatus Rokuibacteriota bacterium]|nr:MAG: MBL fold metallo-hydrolase [Candidatus Rokubacteria bacterium]